MREQDIASKVIDLIQISTGVEKSSITPEASLTDDLGLDSLDDIELIMAIEEEFDIEITDEEAERIKTVQQTIDAVKARVKVES
jgi:acyl carrier protein